MGPLRLGLMHGGWWWLVLECVEEFAVGGVVVTGTFSTKVTAARSFAGKFVHVQRLRSTGATTVKR
jgi:hypothetical protein